MSFSTRRGARQPAGRLYRLLNTVMTGRIRRSGSIGGMNALLLHTVGAKSGQERVNPVNWFPDREGSWVIVASARGAARNPGWYHNIRANPDEVRVEVQGRTVPVTAEELTGEERVAVWRRISEDAERFATYQERTDRELPIIRLTRRPSAPTPEFA